MLFLSENTNHVAGDQTDDKVVKELNALCEEMGFGEIDHFSGDEAGAMEICLELETAWAALTQDMMSVEHSAIVNEDTILLEGALKDFWNKVKEIFAKVWNSIKNFFAKAVTMLRDFLQNAEKWWAKNQKNIKSGAKATVNTNSYVADGKCLELAQKTASDVTSLKLDEMNADVSKKNIKAREDALKETKKAVGDQKEREMTKEAAGKNIVGSGAMIAKLEGINKTVATYAQTGIKVATAQAGAAEKSKDADKAKKHADALRQAMMVGQRYAGFVISVVKGGVSDSLTASKKMLSESK